MFAVEASTAPGVLETEIPVLEVRLDLQNVRRDLGENTFGSTCLGVNLVVACTIMGDELYTSGECIDKLLIEAPGYLLEI